MRMTATECSHRAPILLTISLILLACVPAHAGADPSFWGVDGHMVWPPRGFLPAHMAKMSDAGVTAYGIEFLDWGAVVEDTLIAAAGPDSFDWFWPDLHVQAVEDQGGDALIKIWCRADWATGGDSLNPQWLWPPKDGPTGDPDRYWDYWGVFCRELVERYDGDGVRDMGHDTDEPEDDLDHPHLHFQIQGESEWRWQSTAADYVRLLGVAHDSMKVACDDVQVFYSSFNLGNYFDDNPSLEEARQAFAQSGSLAVAFVETMLSAPQYFDVAPTQMNHDYTGIPSRLRWLNWAMQDSFGYDRPIWFVDAAAGYMLNSHPLGAVEPNPHYAAVNLPPDVLASIQTHPQYADSLVEGIMVDILQRGSGAVAPGDYRVIKDWWEADKAAYALKKSAISAGLGVKHIYSQWTFENSADPCIELSGWATCGLLEDKDPDDESDLGTARPVYYTMALFNRIVGPFDSAEVVLPGGPGVLDGLGPLWYETWVIEFDRGGDPLFIAWADEGADTVDLTGLVSADDVIVSHIVSDLDGNDDPVYLPEETFPVDEVVLSRVPVFITGYHGTSVNDDPAGSASLFQSMPNPSSGAAAIRVAFARPAERDGAIVRIYDGAGRLVRELVVPVEDDPEAEVIWDGRDSLGSRASSGVYFYQLVTGGVAGRGRKLLLIR